MVQATSPSFTREDWQKGYQSLRTEQSYWIDEIEGEIPSELQGTLFRNGPGLLDVNGQAYGHPFDGDGMICAIAFTQGKAHFANSFVKTPEFLAEQKEGRILYRGVFGTQKPGGWWQNLFDLKLKNIANTNVIYHGKRLLALWEASLPYRLDPKTLDTLGVETFNGTLAAGKAFTAHPRLDPETGDLWAFGVEAGPKSTITIYKIDPQGELTESCSQKVSGFCFLHDFAYTPNYRIFLQNPVAFNTLPFILGLKTAGACIDLKPNTPTKILLFDRSGKLTTLETDPGFVFHHCNAFEQGDEIILDSVCYQDYPKLEPNVDYKNVNFDTVVPGKLCRYRIDLRTGSVSREILLDRSCEFPTIHPRCVGQPYRYAYIGAIAQPTGNAPLQAILKIDLATGKQEAHSFAPRGFIGEPVFVPRNASTTSVEDDGWIITLIFNAERDRSDVVILDAQNIAAAPVATLHLKHHVPYGLHGNFTPEIWH
ncbi:carotenoid oxygenase family protein [Tumidithrix elongata RA019]|uniref:Carotenoid oxygenase family protein n=1 Tax=Tumidithrix elongata BACA0141 TaxID=2716417 RepID=A0AAW9PYN2_9CYAN|nr:carotenoid oxygenase family protein [Tumidithrix elongata RA019]